MLRLLNVPCFLYPSHLMVSSHQCLRVLNLSTHLCLRLLNILSHLWVRIPRVPFHLRLRLIHLSSPQILNWNISLLPSVSLAFLLWLIYLVDCKISIRPTQVPPQPLCNYSLCHLQQYYYSQHSVLAFAQSVSSYGERYSSTVVSTFISTYHYTN